MAHRWLFIAGIALAVGVMGPEAASPAGRQPGAGPTAALQKLAEKQGHPAAVGNVLKNFGHQVPPEIEEAAAGIKPDALKSALQQRGTLSARLETLLGKPLSEEQAKPLSEAEKSHARAMENLRRQYVEQVAQVTGLPAAKLRPILLRSDNTARKLEKGVIPDMEKLLGRQLSAADVGQVRSARETLLAKTRSQQEAFARQVAGIAKIPQHVALALTR